eukprot:gene12772-14983_t
MVAAKQTEHKDIVVFIGRSGSGKTTTIYYLCGATMSLVNQITTELVDGFEMTSERTVIDVENPSGLGQDHVIGHSLDSQTKVIAPHVSAEGTILVDTPGSQDTEGEAVDLAGSVGITRAIRAAKSVRPVLILDFKTLDAIKGTEFNDLLDFCINLISDLQASIKSLTVAFTHMDVNKPLIDQYQSIMNKVLVYLKAENTLNPDGSSKKLLLNHIAVGVKANISRLKDSLEDPTSRNVIIANPLCPEERSNLYSIIMSKPAIPNPENVFRYNVSPASQSFVEKTIFRLHLTVTTAVNTRDYGTMFEAIDMIKLLATKLDGLSQMVTRYLAAVANITQHYGELVNSVKQYLEDAFKGGIMNIKFIDKQLTSIKSIDLMRNRGEDDKAHFSDEIETYDHVMDCLVHIAVQCQMSLKDITEFSSLKIQLVKLCQLASFMDDFKPCYKGAQDIATCRVQSLIDDANNAVKATRWEDASRLMIKILEAQCLGDYLVLDIPSKYAAILESISVTLKDHSDYIIQTFNDEAPLSVNDLNTVRDKWSVLQSASVCTALGELLKTSISDNYMSSATEMILAKVQDIIGTITNIKEPLKLISAIKKISILQQFNITIREKTYGPYKSALRDVERRVENMVHDVQVILNSSDSSPKSLKSVSASLVEVHKYAPLDEYLSDKICESLYIESLSHVRSCILDLQANITEALVTKNYHLVLSLTHSLHSLTDPLSFNEASKLAEECELGQICKNTVENVQTQMSEICEVDEKALANIITQGQWSKLSLIIQNLELFKMNPLGQLASKTLKTVQSSLETYLNGLADQVHRNIKLESLNFKQVSAALMIVTKTKCQKDIHELIGTDFYHDLDYVVDSSICTFFERVRSVIYKKLFSEYTQYQQALQDIQGLARSYRELGIGGQVLEMHQLYQDAHKNIVANFGEMIKSHNYDGLLTAINTIDKESPDHADLVGNIRAMLVNDEYAIRSLISLIDVDCSVQEIGSLPGALSQYRRASQLKSILGREPDHYDIDSKIAKIDQQVITRLDYLIEKQAEFLKTYDYSKAHDIGEIIKSIINKINNQYADEINICQYIERSKVSITKAIESVDKSLFLKQLSQVRPVLTGLIKAAKSVSEFGNKIHQLEELYTLHVNERIDTIRHEMNGNGEYDVAKKSLDKLVMEVRDMEKCGLSISIGAIEEELRCEININMENRDNTFRNCIGQGKFDAIKEIDMNTQAIQLVKKQIAERLTDMENSLRDQRYEELATHLTWFANLHSSMVGEIIKKSNTSQVNIDEMVDKLTDFAKKLVGEVKSSINDNVPSVGSLDHFVQLNTHLSTYITVFTSLHKSVSDCLAKYIGGFQDIVRDALEQWDKTPFINNKATWNSLSTCLDTLKLNQPFFARATVILGRSDQESRVSLHAQMCRQLSNKIGERLKSFSNDINVHKKYQECSASMLILLSTHTYLTSHSLSSEDSLHKLHTDLQGHIDRIITDGKRHWSNKSMADYNKSLETAKVIEREFSAVPQAQANTVVSSILSVAKSWIHDQVLVSHSLSTDQVAPLLVEIRMISDNVPLLKEEVDTVTNTILKIHTEVHGLGAINTLGNILNTMDRLGKEIVSDYPQFQSVLVSIWNKKTAQLDINYVKEQVRGDNIDKSLLLDSYNSFDKKYQELIKSGLSDIDNATKTIVKGAKSVASYIPPKMNTDKSREGVISLMAHIFALWTITKSGSAFKANNDKSLLMQPHSIQVFAIMRLLGIDNKQGWSIGKVVAGFVKTDSSSSSGPFVNHLIEIKTGEGKSVTLAVLSMVLSLLGFDVSCVSYSSYLSTRDYDSFKDIFALLGIENQINYSTIGNLCEKLINESGDVRSLTHDFVLNTYSSQSVIVSQPRKRILLIDEVDVFLGDSFYGNLHRPLTNIKSSTIVEMYKLVWSLRHSTPQIATIVQYPAYRNLLSQFPGFERMVGAYVKGMISNVDQYNNPPYVVDSKNQRIGYSHHDEVSYSAVHTHCTQFAYLAEFDKGTITERTLKSELVMHLQCGAFSYAKLPGKFDKILGVSGTLETLSETTKSIIKLGFNIHKSTFIPSVFGQTQLVFKENGDVIMEDNQDLWFRKIQENILEVIKHDRAVLVYFDNETTMKAYESSVYCVRDKLERLVEDSPNRDSIIKKASTARQVTLLTRVFGRGVDFNLRDDTVINAGGVHVIQTFLSEEITEEIQIKGRAARQGQKGSFKMILVKSQLVSMGISEDKIQLMAKSNTFYKELDQERQSLFNVKCEGLKEDVKIASEENDLSNSSVIAPGVIPPSVETLYFHEMDPVLQVGTLPPLLHTLELSRFNRPLALPSVFPTSLVKLSLGHCFNQPLPPYVLPPNLEVLDLSRSRFNEKLDRGSIPDSARVILFSDCFNKPLHPDILPHSLLELTFGSRFNQPLEINSIPSSVTKLCFGREFNQLLALGVLPPSLIDLKFNGLKQPLLPGVLPPSLDILHLGTYYKSLGHGILPTSLRTLSMAAASTKDFVLPESLTIFTASMDLQSGYPPDSSPSNIEDYVLDQLVIYHSRYERHITDIPLVKNDSIILVYHMPSFIGSKDNPDGSIVELVMKRRGFKIFDMNRNDIITIRFNVTPNTMGKELVLVYSNLLKATFFKIESIALIAFVFPPERMDGHTSDAILLSTSCSNITASHSRVSQSNTKDNYFGDRPTSSSTSA